MDKPYPDPVDQPDQFLDHLKANNLNVAVSAFVHAQTRPTDDQGRIGSDVQQWSEHLDSLLGKLNRVKVSPEQRTLLGAVQDYCVACHEHVETLLIKQNDADEAELKRISDAIKVKEEAERLAAEQEEKERAENARKLAQEQSDIDTAERALAAKKAALRDAKKAAQIVVNDNDEDDDDDDDEEEEDDQASQSGAADQGTPKKPTRRQQEDARGKLPQIVHAKHCVSCDRGNEEQCSGPVGQSCNLCWKQKKSCSNGGRRRPRELPIKEETKPPAKSATKKRKVYSTTDANPVGTMDVIDVDFESAQPVGKRSKLAAGPSHVRFDGVAMTRQTRKSTRSTSTKATTTKELFERLAQDYSVVAKASERIAETCERIAETCK